MSGSLRSAYPRNLDIILSLLEKRPGNAAPRWVGEPQTFQIQSNLWFLGVIQSTAEGEICMPYFPVIGEGVRVRHPAKFKILDVQISRQFCNDSALLTISGSDCAERVGPDRCPWSERGYECFAPLSDFVQLCCLFSSKRCIPVFCVTLRSTVTDCDSVQIPPWLLTAAASRLCRTDCRIKIWTSYGMATKKPGESKRCRTFNKSSVLYHNQTAVVVDLLSITGLQLVNRHVM